jgi:hypothetical protein
MHAKLNSRLLELEEIAQQHRMRTTYAVRQAALDALCSGRIRTANRGANAGSDHGSKSENNGSRNVLHANPSWVYAGPGSGFCFSRSSYDAAQHALSVTYFLDEPSGCR